jgi:hypothetical protein
MIPPRPCAGFSAGGCADRTLENAMRQPKRIARTISKLDRGGVIDQTVRMFWNLIALSRQSQNPEAKAGVSQVTSVDLR